ncbi:peptide ABC transporter substrate-binding protein [Brevibacillus fluminis]
MKKKLIRCMSMFVLLGGMLAGCSSNYAATPAQPTQPQSQGNAGTTDAGSKAPQILHLNVEEPSSLDTVSADEANSGILIRELFDGLTRFDEDGNAVKSLAEDIKVSDDQLVYTFTLRDSKWTNGDPVTAEDFAYTWMRNLDPKNASPNAYSLFDVKNAKAYYSGKAKAEDVGIKALDVKTLQVTLEHPTSYFLALTPFFTPVNKKAVEANPQAWWKDPSTFVSNGAFKLDTWEHKSKLVLAKNDTYWDKDAVKLDKIEFSMVADTNTELEMFNHGDLDWAGGPLSSLPADAIPVLKEEGKLKSKMKAANYYIKFQTEKAPFTNEKIRKAFAYAINRQELTDNVTQAGQTPLLGFVPQSMALKPEGYFKDSDSEQAKTLLAEGMKELGVTTLPTVTFMYNTSDMNKKIAEALQAQWKKTLNTDVKLENYETKVFLQNQEGENYMFSRSSWVADYNDPINFLEKFTEKESSSNNTRWFNQKYTDLVEGARVEKDAAKRKQMYTEAETILMDAMPVTPLYTNVNAWVQNDNLKGVIVDALGYVDFRFAYKE